jgi:hypothetical protein
VTRPAPGSFPAAAAGVVPVPSVSLRVSPLRKIAARRRSPDVLFRVWACSTPPHIPRSENRGRATCGGRLPQPWRGIGHRVDSAREGASDARIPRALLGSGDCIRVYPDGRAQPDMCSSAQPGAVRCRPVPDEPAEHVDCRRRGPMPHWDGLRSQRRPADRTPGLHDAYGSRAVWGSQCSSMSGTGRDTFGAGVRLRMSCGCRDSARASAVQFVRPSEGARPRVAVDHGAQNRRGA